jgi:hypothetical protein
LFLHDKTGDPTKQDVVDLFTKSGVDFEQEYIDKSVAISTPGHLETLLLSFPSVRSQVRSPPNSIKEVSEARPSS